MTMFLAPYTAIADIDGSPLDAGFIYFGKYGKDPELFPIEVFWDADFTVPAAQPIRTRNGYPVRNGSPTKVYPKTALHSIAIKNRNSAFILVDFFNKGWDASFVVDGKQTQKQINARTITPYDYGAIQNSSAPVSEWYTASAANYRGYADLAAVQVDYPHVVDGTEFIAWAALQKFFNVLNSGMSNAVYNLVGTFFINKELNCNGNNLAGYNRNCVVNCDATLWDKSTTDREYILAFENASQITFKGIIRGIGVGSSTYSSRRTKDIFLVKAGCSYSVFDVLAPQYAKRWGVSCLNSSTQMVFNCVKAAYCGTSYDATSPAVGQKYTVSSIVNNGTANSTQSSVLTLTTPLNSVVEPFDGHMYSGTANIPYEITEISADRLQVTVRPWVNPAHADAEWHLFVGGAVCTLGSDSSVHNFNYIDSLTCGVGYWAKSLYGANVGTLTTQFNNIGWVASRSIGDASPTGFISQFYCEGNYFNILLPNTGNWAIGNIISPFTTSKVISYRYVDSSTYDRATKGSLRGLQILNSSGKAINQVSGGIYQTSSTTLSPHNDNTMPMLIKYRDAPTITLIEEESIASLTGKVGYILTAMGSGANNQPTGTWTFNPRSGSGWTVNGGTTYTLSGFTEATNILIYADYVNKNWIVKGMNLVPIKSGNVIYDPVSLTTGARTAISTITVTGAALGDKVAMAFSRDLQGVNLEGYVSAAATVSFYFENRTGATVDLASGTVSAKII